ncbi:MAG: 2-succinyl-5-enolpyruvyl-6-hydroxy-3-cyclohexene-1-carboxylic-acid synthase, partial [Cyclobacteriaceae bacterium]|nr:2-succinyl-5-enolpyruvyl-6-hydroxy-3-cyclohexene-1-carboxylic-acid synthase [Cyclobacteriaceae bacterium]
MIIQPIVNIAEICAQHNIKQAVICPGSRSAPLTLAFARHPKINTFVIPDERSAGFIGLGIAQSGNTPVALICTSGTAAANLYPAIIEAFYQQVPLLIFTADRPPEWIDQQDGQTIRQNNMFQNHILASYQFPVSFDHEEAKWHAEKMVSEAILKASGLSSGPVHINIPIREPFYPSADEKYQYSNSLKVIKAPRMEMTPTIKQVEDLENELNIHAHLSGRQGKIMVLAGQSPLNKELINLLMKIQKKLKWVVVGDIIANIHGLQHMISSHDIILNNLSEIYELQPDLLITFGKTVLSKSLKTFIRTNQPAEHWQIGEDHEVIDAFKSLTKKVLLNPIVFFKIVEESSLVLNK